MKQREAFALRGYDGKRILQRPFFKSLKLPVGTDAEILDALKVANDDSVDDMENKLIIMKGVCYRVAEFQNFISRHMKRLGDLNLAKAKSEGVKLSELKGNALMLEYVSAIPILNLFLEEWKKNYFELEKQIQERYRREFSARLRQARIAAGLTQRQLGELIQISPNGYNHYETGKREPSLPTLSRLLKVFSAEQLFGRIKE